MYFYLWFKDWHSQRENSTNLSKKLDYLDGSVVMWRVLIIRRGKKRDSQRGGRMRDYLGVPKHCRSMPFILWQFIKKIKRVLIVVNPECDNEQIEFSWHRMGVLLQHFSQRKYTYNTVRKAAFLCSVLWVCADCCAILQRKTQQEGEETAYFPL